MEFNFKSLRGSIFMPQIPFSWELFNKLPNPLSTYFPLVNSTNNPFITNELVLGPGEWMLVSPDKRCKIIFQGQKIDYIEISNQGYSLEVLNRFCQDCKSYFQTIIASSSEYVSRIAIAPTFEYVGKPDTFYSYVNDSFSKKSFKDSSIDNCDFSQVYRVTENILGTPTLVNYLSKFFQASEVISNNGINELQEKIRLSFDINTKLDPTVRFSKEQVLEFFSEASNFCSTFLKFYFCDI